MIFSDIYIGLILYGILTNILRVWRYVSEESRNQVDKREQMRRMVMVIIWDFSILF